MKKLILKYYYRILKEYDAMFYRHNRNRALYGDTYMNTVIGNMTELGLRLYELKIEIMKVLVK